MRGSLRELTVSRAREFWREPGAMFWTFGFPLLLTVALGIAFRNQGPQKVAVAVVEGPGAQRVLDQLAVSARLAPELSSATAARERLARGEVALVVDGGAREVTYVHDPTRPEAAMARLVVDDLLQRGAARIDVLRVRDEAQAARGARYVDWLVPGLLGLQLMSGSMWGIGWAIVQNRERRLLKRLFATPMRRSDFLLSFLLWRVAIVLVEVGLLLAFAYVAFDVVVFGSIAAVLLVSLLGAAAFAGLALLCASRAQNSQTASGLINLAMLPMFVVSGVFFSAANFPSWSQPAIQALPLTALNDALRALINAGAPLSGVAGELAILGAWGAVCFAVALKIFRWT